MKVSRLAIPIVLCLLTGCQSVRQTERSRPAPDGERLAQRDGHLPIQSGWPDQLQTQHASWQSANDAVTSNVRSATFIEGDPPAPAFDIRGLPAGDDYPLTLEWLQETALASQPAIAQAAAEVAALQGKWMQAGLAPNPSIGYLGGEMGDVGTAGQQGGFVRQQFITGGKLGLSRAVICEEILRAEQRLAAQQQRVLTDVNTAFYDVLLAQRTLEVAGELVVISDQAVETSQQLLDAKEIPLVGLLQTQVVAHNAQIVKRRAENANTAAWRRLTSVLGQPHMLPRRLDGELEWIANELHWKEQLERLLAESPEIAIAASELSRARWALDRAHAEVVPDLSVQVAVQHGNVTDDTLASVQVQLPIPLWNKNQGGIEQALSEITAAERNIDRVELDLRQRLASAFQRYSDARYQVAEISEEILPLAKETFELVTQGFEQGEVGYLDLLTAQRTFFQTSLSHIDALRELWRAAIRIDGLLLDGSLSRGQEP